MTKKDDKCFGCGPICKSTCWSGGFLFLCVCRKFVSTASRRPAQLPSLQAQTTASATPAVKNHLNRPHLTINSPFVQANDPPLPRTLCNSYTIEVLGFSCECVCVRVSTDWVYSFICFLKSPYLSYPLHQTDRVCLTSLYP